MKYGKQLIIPGVLTIIVGIFLLLLRNQSQDVALFWSLSQVLVTQGLKAFYQLNASDYLPGFLIYLYLIGKLYFWLISIGVNINPNAFYQLPAILADNLTILILSFIISWYFLLHKNWWIGAVTLGLALTIQPFVIILLPLYQLYINQDALHFKVSFLFTVLIFTIVIISFVPFSNPANLVSLFSFQYSYVISHQLLPHQPVIFLLILTIYMFVLSKLFRKSS